MSYAIGWWCPRCETFEEPGPQTSNDCDLCGCPNVIHKRAKVVEA